MIAYNSTTLNNIRLIKKVKQWYARGLLTTAQVAAAEDRYPVNFYTPNLFVKVGLFLFTWVAVGAASGLFSLFFMGLLDSGHAEVMGAFLCLVLAAGCTGMLELLIRQKKLYRSGIDEALLYAAIVFAGCSVGLLLPGWFSNGSNTVLSFSVLMMPLLAIAVVRYADAVAAFLLCACVYTVFFLLVLKLGAIAKMVMPFALMVLSAAIYFTVKRQQRNGRLRDWHTATEVCEVVSLVMFYLSGNYYVIREASVAFFDLQLAPGQDVPFAMLFYLFTALVPLVYVGFGLKRKDRLLLWTGLAAVAAGALTFKYYFSTGHPEIILTLAGALLMVAAYAAIRYLNTPKHGLTFEKDPDEDSFLQTNAEALLQARTFGGHHHAPANTTEFGGGSGGGGGATGNGNGRVPGRNSEFAFTVYPLLLFMNGLLSQYGI